MVHDDVIKWKHFPRYWPFVRRIHRSPVNSSHKGQWRGALMFSLICVWINDWVNNGEAGDLRRYSIHYDVTVMIHHTNFIGIAQVTIHCNVMGITKFKLQQFLLTSSNGTFSALLALCAGYSPVTGEFPLQRPVTWSLDVFFDLRLNKRQAIFRNKTGTLLIEPLGAILRKLLIEILTFSYKKMCPKAPSAILSRPQCVKS